MAAERLFAPQTNPCQLGKSQAKELIEAGKAAQFVITAVPHDALVELVSRNGRPTRCEQGQNRQPKFISKKAATASIRLNTR
jgi:hypothetical protein